MTNIRPSTCRCILAHCFIYKETEYRTHTSNMAQETIKLVNFFIPGEPTSQSHPQHHGFNVHHLETGGVLAQHIEEASTRQWFGDELKRLLPSVKERFSEDNFLFVIHRRVQTSSNEMVLIVRILERNEEGQFTVYNEIKKKSSTSGTPRAERNGFYRELFEKWLQHCAIEFERKSGSSDNDESITYTIRKNESPSQGTPDLTQMSFN